MIPTCFWMSPVGEALGWHVEGCHVLVSSGYKVSETCQHCHVSSHSHSFAITKLLSIACNVCT
jgi:hypothetical protein